MPWNEPQGIAYSTEDVLLYNLWRSTICLLFTKSIRFFRVSYLPNLLRRCWCLGSIFKDHPRYWSYCPPSLSPHAHHIHLLISPSVLSGPFCGPCFDSIGLNIDGERYMGMLNPLPKKGKVLPALLKVSGSNVGYCNDLGSQKSCSTQITRTR
jgi:hypothetical protein